MHCQPPKTEYLQFVGVSLSLVSGDITADSQVRLTLKELNPSLDHTSIQLLIAGTPAIATDPLPAVLLPDELVIAVFVQRCGHVSQLYSPPRDNTPINGFLVRSVRVRLQNLLTEPTASFVTASSSPS